MWTRRHGEVKGLAQGHSWEVAEPGGEGAQQPPKILQIFRTLLVHHRTGPLMVSGFTG